MDLPNLPYIEIQGSDDREAWLKARTMGIGASESPGVLGLSRWSSPTSIAAAKILGEEEIDSSVMEAGRRLEPVILEWTGELVGTRVRPYGVLIQSTEWPWMICTPDAVIGEPKLFGHDANFAVTRPNFLLGFPEGHYPLQLKNTVLADEWAEEPPPAVIIQVHHEMAVTGAPVGYAAALLFGNRLKWARIERDEEMIKLIVEKTHDLWQKIEKREPIFPDASDATKKALQRLYPKDTGEEIALSAEFIYKDDEIQALKAEQKTTSNTIRGLENELREALGSATIGVLPNGVRYKYRVEPRKEHMVKASEPRILRRLKAKS